MRLRTIALILTGALGMAGCGIYGASPGPPSSPVRPPARVSATSGSPTPSPGAPVHRAAAVGWYALPLEHTTAGDTIITGFRVDGGHLAILAAKFRVGSNPVPLQYAYHWDPSQLEGPRSSTVSAPRGLLYGPPRTSVQLTFPPSGKPPLFTEGKKVVAPFPSGVAVYQSGINPATQPGPLDNTVIGVRGPWVWVALKGPKQPPFHGIVWHYRTWNRIMAFNLHTRRYYLYPIPRLTSFAGIYDAWGYSPAFGVDGSRVLIGVGPWLGVFPANPPTAVSPVVRGPSLDELSRRTHVMRQQLSALYWQASDGLAAEWNCVIMKDPSQAACPKGPATATSWVLTDGPAVINHGDYPARLLWAADFPLSSNPSANRQRNRMVRTILRLSSSPLVTAEIAYPDPAKARAHFHRRPPIALPGYTIRNGYYWAKSGR